MVTSFREVFITFALIGVFVFATTSFIIRVQEENGVSQENTIAGDCDNCGIINITHSKLETNLSGFSSSTQTQRESFEVEVPERGFGSLIIFAIVGVGQTFTALIIGVYNIMIVLPAQILNVPEVVVSVLSAIFIVSIVLLIWRVYRVGG